MMKYLISLSLITLCFLILGPSGDLLAGSYTISAHGDSSAGVDRTCLPNYATGNCSHCHEQHASIGGQEPDPAGGAPSSFALFSSNFDSSVITGPYDQADNFCFYCHIQTGGVQAGGGIVNYQFAETFAGYNGYHVSDIMEAFNTGAGIEQSYGQGSFHNLKDIQDFSDGRFSFFKTGSNPCVACHNPHLAKRNKDNPTDPAYSAIAKPSDHDNLWGDEADEKMSNYTYRAPYYYGSTITYEPGGTVLNDGSQMPDYNAFCLDCHQYEVPSVDTPSMNGNTTAGYLTAIDWSAAGDMHGGRARYFGVDGEPKGFGTVTAPYDVAPVESNYVLSCIDCHEPHGSLLRGARGSSFLLRKEVNGNVVDGCGPLAENFCEQDFCGSCHTYGHCGGPQGCFGCHYHGGENIFCGPWSGANF